MKHAEKYINGDSYNRSAGILLPVFSLPSPYGIGDMGEGAYRFVDMLREAGQTLWEVLPHGQTGYCNSPYKTLSAFAGNPYFIAPDMLEKTVCFCRGKRSSMTLVQIRLILIMAGCLRQGLSFCVWRSTGFVPAAAKVIPDFWLSAAKMPSGFPITPCLWR